MDIFRFINSKDIRDYLRKRNYEFNSLEAAWLIYQCRNATISEKHKAWAELIQTMPDCKIDERAKTAPFESLHAFLKQYMEIENKLIEEFYDEKHADTFDFEKPFVYKFKYIYKDGSEFNWYGGVFSAIDSLYETIMEPDEDVVSIKCTKIQIDRLNMYPQTAYLTPSFEFLSLDPGCINNKAERDIYSGVFDDLWFKFPTPFKKGDIVWDPMKPNPNGMRGGPFVLTELSLDRIKSDEIKESISIFGDNYDMCAEGYFLKEDGSIHHEAMWNYMNLEFYKEELTGPKRTLIALSNFIKGKIDTVLFARAYHQILTAEYAQNSVPHDYLKFSLILAGLSKPEHIKIWLDDIIEAPKGYYHCHSVNETMQKIIKCEKKYNIIEEINCDHDLGDYTPDGGDAIKLIDWLTERKTYYPIALHSGNPVERENIQRKIERYCKNKINN